MLYFCTLFDSKYAAKGLTMYHSLVRVCPSFTLFVFAFDELLADTLKKMNLEHIVVITLSEFEDPELLRVKPTRKPGEYCWTCTASTILYCLKHYDIDHCTYLDSDLYFYANPQVLLDEMNTDDVLITEHRYSPQYDVSKTYGRFCVQFVTFKNTDNSLSILKKWREDCIEWCYDRFENGKMGDQMYLNNWEDNYSGIHVLQHLGGGIAPWNMQQYYFKQSGKSIKGTVVDTGESFNIVFCHFHCIRTYKKGFLFEYRLPNYELSVNGKKVIYDGYIRHLKKSRNMLINIDHHFKTSTTQYTEAFSKDLFRKIILALRKKDLYSFYSIEL